MRTSVPIDTRIPWVRRLVDREGARAVSSPGPKLTALRRRFPQLTPRHFMHGKNADGSFGVLWLTPQATEMQEADWKFPEGRFLAYLLGAVGDAEQQAA